MGDVRFIVDVDTKKGTAAIRKFDDSIDKLEGTAKKATGRFTGMWKQMAVGLGVTQIVSSGIRMMRQQFMDTIRVGREFEREWANVTTMLTVSQEETDKMRKELLRLSPTLGDTTDLAKGMYQVLSASIKPAKAIRLLGVAAKSAKAGVTDTRTAVDALTTVINAYGLEAEAATEISDIMFGIVKKGKLTYEELAQSIGTVVPAASMLGIEFREIGAATATLTRQGIQASKATMYLRQTLMAVIKASDETKQKARDLGFEFTAQALKAKGLGEFLFDLKEATGGNAELLKVFIPDVRALSGVMALTGQAAQGLADDLDFLKEVSGFTDEAFQKQMESMDFWVEVMKTSADKVKIAAYEGFVDPMRETIRTAEDFDEKVTARVNATAVSVKYLLKGASTWFSYFAKYYSAIWNPVINLLAKFEKKIDDVDPSLEALNEQIEVWTTGVANLIPVQEQENRELEEALLLYQKLKAEILFELPVFEVPKLVKSPEELLEGIGFTDIGEAFETEVSGLGDFFLYEWEKSMAGAEEVSNQWLNNMVGALDQVKAGTEDAGKIQIDMLGMLGTALYSMGTHSKALAYAGAVISTAHAVTKALPNIPLSIIVGLMGGFQIAKIASTSVPSAATGAYIPRETFVHVHPGETILQPMEKSPIVREMMGGGRPVHVHIYGYDGRKLTDIIVDTVNRNEDIKIDLRKVQ